MKNQDNLYLPLTSQTSEYDRKLLMGRNWLKLSSIASVRLLSVVVAIAILGIANQAMALTLRRGNNGTEVLALQRCLQRLGYLQATPNGNFGPATQAAVTRFQSASGLRADGIVGGNTQRALISRCDIVATPGRPVPVNGLLRVGDRGAAVTNLQQDLRRLGYFDPQPTGVFGAETRQAVLQFQQDNRLVADGIVGTRTRDALQLRISQLRNDDGIGGDDFFPYNLNLGDRSAEVRYLQEDLRRLGYFNDPPSGYFGPLTQTAVSNFQRDYGLNQTGVADSRTLDAIRRALAGSNNGGNSGSRRTLARNSSGADVRELQELLRRAGYFPGTPTGFFGSATESAVIAFQRNNRITQNGIVGNTTWTALQRVARAPKNRYVVVVPIRENGTLNRVRQYIPDAYAADSRLGDYVNAGEFRDRNLAASRSNYLRSRGLDARVEYF